jgi:uncharacterized membrane protein YhhN
MNILILSVLAAVTAAHLWAILRGKGRLRKISKVCLMPLLILSYALRAERPLLMVILGAVFGWAGDILLIRISRPRYFKLGLGGFLLGHLCYILSMLRLAGGVRIPAFIISGAVMLPLGFLLIGRIRPPPAMRVPAVLYGITLGLMSVSALQLMLARMDAAGFAVFGGSLLFLISDTTLGYLTFRNPTRGGSFFVMLTYVAAQGCIVTALALC